MTFIKEIQTVADHLAISIQSSNIRTIQPCIKLAENTYIKKLLGTYYATLYAKFNAEPQTLTDLETEIVGIIQGALANLAYMLALPEINVNVSDAGVQIVGKSAFQWQVRELAESYEYKGYDAIEELLEFLEENVDHADLADWKNSEAHKITRQYLINSAREFSQYYHIRFSRRVFLLLLPILQKTEDFDLEPHLSAEYFAELKAEVLAGNISADNKIILRMLRPALAHLAMARAADEMSLQFTDKGILVYAVKSGTENNSERSAAQRDRLADLKLAARNDGQAYLKKAVNYLNKNASATQYATYYTSEAYTDPAASGSESSATDKVAYF